MTIANIVKKIYLLLKTPFIDNNLLEAHHFDPFQNMHKYCFNKDCISIMKENEEEYKKIAREWTLKYA